ncbi:MAG: phosphate permease, partial [Gammaproteobacteria bacterium RIFCSPHIGHO2_12_FULL_45_9]
MEHGQLYIVLAGIFGFFMAWGIGANDVANAMGTSVGSKALTLKKALIVAAIFEALGALLAGGQVTDTLRGKIIDAQLFSDAPQLFIYGMLASLLAAGTWLVIATSLGWPVSTTHSIVGAVVGFGWIVLGTRALYWSEIIYIVLSWIITPVIAAVVAYLLFRSVQWLIFDSDLPLRNAKRYVPWYIFLVALVISLVTTLNGLKHIGIFLTISHSVWFAVGVSVIAMLVGIGLMKKIPSDQNDTKPMDMDFARLEKMFGVLMIFTACAMAFAHGSNDVANAIGPLSAVVGIVQGGGAVLAQARIPFWVMILGAVGIVSGLAMYGYRVIATVGSQITQLTPSRGFAAQLATASTVVIASGIGLPV